MTNPKLVEEEMREGCYKVLKALNHEAQSLQAEIDFLISKRASIERKMAWVKRELIG